ncbi:6-N-hydroxylaminopurine resistance protein [Phycisphaerae bacterium RAS1]|nr:6-N-hydroxylaminopurine resistance protein [Phycisphaerae bacterium RAS1]
MSRTDSNGMNAEVVAVCTSTGGVPKHPVDWAEVRADGLVGDGHDHEKHRRPHRAVCIQDVELLEELRAEGFAVAPGVIGENLTVRGLHVQKAAPGDRLQFDGGPLLELSEPRKPCYVLDKIDARLQAAVAGRCGYLARVIEPGRLYAGQQISLTRAAGGVHT